MKTQNSIQLFFFITICVLNTLNVSRRLSHFTRKLKRTTTKSSVTNAAQVYDPIAVISNANVGKSQEKKGCQTNSFIVVIVKQRITNLTTLESSTGAGSQHASFASYITPQAMLAHIDAHCT